MAPTQKLYRQTHTDVNMALVPFLWIYSGQTDIQTTRRTHRHFHHRTVIIELLTLVSFSFLSLP